MHEFIFFLYGVHAKEISNMIGVVGRRIHVRFKKIDAAKSADCIDLASEQTIIRPSNESDWSFRFIVTHGNAPSQLSNGNEMERTPLVHWSVLYPENLIALFVGSSALSTCIRPSAMLSKSKYAPPLRSPISMSFSRAVILICPRFLQAVILAYEQLRLFG